MLFCLAQLWRRTDGGFLEQHPKVRLFGFRNACDRNDFNLDAPSSTVVPERHVLLSDSGHLLLCAREYRAQVREQAFLRHVQDIELRLTGWRFKVPTGTPAELKDFHPSINQHTRWRVARQKNVICLSLDVGGGRPTLKSRTGNLSPSDSVVFPHELECQVALQGRSGKNPLLLIYRREELLKPEDGLCVAEQEKARQVQRMMVWPNTCRLKRETEIDEVVSTADQVQLRKGRISR